MSEYQSKCTQSVRFMLHLMDCDSNYEKLDLLYSGFHCFTRHQELNIAKQRVVWHSWKLNAHINITVK
jgi:hypothetical protein